MEDAKIIEGNKLIAEFMGWRKDPTHGWLTKDEQDAWNYRDDYHFKYYVSWDWLMPVVEKIEGLNNGENGKGYIVSLKSPSCVGYIDKEDGFKMPIPCDARTLGTTRIESVWLAVVEFIQWYNKNKKS